MSGHSPMIDSSLDTSNAVLRRSEHSLVFTEEWSLKTETEFLKKKAGPDHQHPESISFTVDSPRLGGSAGLIYPLMWWQRAEGTKLDI